MDEHTLLIVDDTPENLQVLYRAFEGDYRIFAATSGREALTIADARRPDVILLDVLMPEMDGFEVCRRLKESAALQHIPVIFVTALGQMEDESRGLRLGAADYITKPINTELVRLRVRNQLDLKDRTDALERRTRELEELLSRLKRLEGIITICMYCKRIRNEQDSWQQVESYVSDHSDASFSHGLCPGCLAANYPEL